MSSDRAADALFFGVLLALPLAALVVRRVPLAPTLKMALAWVAIFGVGLLVVSQRDRFSGLTQMFSDQRVSGSETRIQMASDGHFWADVSINGITRRMLIDSGATTTALTTETARAAGVNVEESPFPQIVGTANGEVLARSATAGQVVVGSITVQDLGVDVAREFDTDLLGMNFLSRLGSWRVEGKTLVLAANQHQH